MPGRKKGAKRAKGAKDATRAEDTRTERERLTDRDSSGTEAGLEVALERIIPDYAEATAAYYARQGAEDWPSVEAAMGDRPPLTDAEWQGLEDKLAAAYLAETGADVMAAADLAAHEATWPDVRAADNPAAVAGWDAHLEALTAALRAKSPDAPTPGDWLATARWGRGPLLSLAFGLQRAARARVERKVADLTERLEDAQKRRRPTLRQGLVWLRSVNQGEDHVQTARKRAAVAGRITHAEAEARRLFQFEPLGWAERLVVHALAAMARDQGLLDAHPWALQRRPLADTTHALRVRLPFPGIAELARVAGFEPDKSGRISKDTRAVVERALRDLTSRPRWIVEPVLVRVKGRGGRGELVNDERVTQTLWVEATATVLTRQAELLLHPVAFASHLASYVPVDNLAARYDAARRAIGRRKMLDEWAAADDYLRYIASVKLGDERAAARRTGASGEEVAAMLTAGDLTVRARIADATLRARIGVTHLARDRGETKARERVADALAFAKAMGTLRGYTATEGKAGPVWDLELAHPGVHLGDVDPAQGLLFAPDEVEDEAL